MREEYTMKIISIEGAIGVGKSTVLQLLMHLFPVFLEPIDEWRVPLEKFYATEEKNDASIQLQYKIIETLQMRHESMKSCKKPIVLMERSLLSSLEVFTKNNSSAFPHPEWEKVESLTRKLISEYEQNDVHYIALNAAFDTILHRSIARGGPEIDANKNYLRSIYDNSIIFENKCNYIIRCDNKSPADIVNEIVKYIHEIK